MLFPPVAVRRLRTISHFSLLSGARRRRDCRGRRDPTTWTVAAEVLESRILLASPTLDWGVSLGSTSGTSTINSTTMDSSGAIYVAGVVSHGTVDVDPGAGTANVTADHQTGFVAKYNSSGAFLWVETFASDTSVNSFSLAVDATGGVYVAGGFRGTTTFGVGESNPATLVSEGGYRDNGFIAKLDQTSGDVAWVDGFFGELALATNNVAIDATGRIFIAGQSGSGSVTIRNGATGTVLDTFNSSASNYVGLLDSTGGVTWAEGFAEGKATIVAGSGLGVDGSGNVYLTGSLLGKDVDFDPGAGSFTLSRTAMNSNTFVAKLDVNGAFVWATKDDATDWKGTSGTSIAVDSSGNTYLTIQQVGGAWGCDFGGRSGSQQQLAKVDSSGTWQWTKTLTPVPPVHRGCSDPPSESCADNEGAHKDNSAACEDVPPDNWSHGNGNSAPSWTPPILHGNVPSLRNRTVSRTTAKVALDSSGNAVVVSASSGATAYSSTGSVVWSTSTAMPVTDVTVDASANIVFVGMFSGTLNVSPDGTDNLDANTRWKKLAPFIVRWNVT